jgi:hypothetical protein
MIVVRVEYWPFGWEVHAQELSRLYVTNDGSESDPFYGNYSVKICAPDKSRHLSENWQHAGRLLRYPRGPKNLWPLIRDALRSVHLRQSKPEPRSHGHIEPYEGAGAANDG